MNNSLNNKILEKIKKDNIQPKPRWQFTLREIGLWFGIVISLFLASVAAGSLIFQSANTMMVPMEVKFWFGFIRLIVIIIFITLAIYQVVRIRRGYRKTKKVYLIFGFIIIAIVGLLFFTSKITGRIENQMGSMGLVHQAQHYWSNPSSTGLLAGELVEITNNGYMILKSLDGNINIVDAQFIAEEDQNVFIEFLRVKMIGYEQDGIFYACSVKPWKMKGRGYEHHKEYKELHDGNIQFGNMEQKNNYFNSYFERKNDIVRTNQCR